MYPPRRPPYVRPEEQIDSVYLRFLWTPTITVTMAAHCKSELIRTLSFLYNCVFAFISVILLPGGVEVVLNEFLSNLDVVHLSQSLSLPLSADSSVCVYECVHASACSTSVLVSAD